MNIGQVFKFASDQAVGHAQRDKIHVFICQTGDFRAPEEFAFLFISSSDYGGCFPIAENDYKSFLTHDSFISCSNLVFYSKEYLAGLNPQSCGTINAEHLKSLHGHLIGAEQMPGWQIKVACNALAEFL